MARAKRSSGTFHVRSFRQKLEVFSSALENNRSRARYLNSAEPLPLNDPDALTELVDQLSLQHEELEVAEEELRAQLDELALSSTRVTHERERYRALFDFAPDALFVTDVHGAIREANVAAAALLNMEPKLLRGKPLATFVERDTKFDLRLAITRAASGERVELEARLQGRRGREAFVVLRGAIADDPKRVLWSARQVPFAFLDSRPPPASGDLFDGATARRTQELEGALSENAQLLDEARKNQVDLEHANQAKDRSLAILAHELRAPLHAILGWTHLLRAPDLSPELHDKGLRVIERNCRAQTSLIENMFDLSRMVADKLEIDRAPVDLTEIATQTVEMMTPTASEKRVRLVSRLEPEMWILGDRQRLGQVITNLLANAIRHSEPGCDVVVSLYTKDDLAELSVADDGDGIDGENLERIFDCFEQGNEGTQKGLGLGLFLVRGFMRMHRGTVRAESEGPGKGARFIVDVPLHDDA